MSWTVENWRRKVRRQCYAFHAVMVITQQGSKMALKHQLLVMSFLLSRSFRSIVFFLCLHNYYSVDTAVGITLYHVARFRHLVSRIASFSFGNVSSCLCHLRQAIFRGNFSISTCRKVLSFIGKTLFSCRMLFQIENQQNEIASRELRTKVPSSNR